MLQGMARVSDFGISYVQPVNQVLNTDQYPNYHVFYNAANTEEFDLGEDDVFAFEKEGDSSKGAKLDVDETTGVVLDGDVEFYQQDPSTVWHRQECLFFMTQVTNGLLEARYSDKWRLGLQISGQEVWVSGGPSTRDPRQLMRRLTDPNYFLLNSLASDELHLFLVGYDVNGAAGMAAGIGDPRGGWGGGPGRNHAFSEAIRSQRLNQLKAAHEIGHLIGGHHSNAIQSGCPGPSCEYSLMNPFLTSQMEYFYSDENHEEIKEVVHAVLP